MPSIAAILKLAAPISILIGVTVRRIRGRRGQQSQRSEPAVQVKPEEGGGNAPE